MITLEIENFDIEQIANSGQCFRMYDLGNGVWEVFALDEKIKKSIPSIVHKKNLKLFGSIISI